MIEKLIIVIVVLLVSGCLRNTHNHQSIYNYYVNHQSDFIKETKVDNLLYLCKYKPIEVAILEKKQSISKEEFKKKLDANRNYFLFELKIKNLQSEVRPINTMSNQKDSLQMIQYSYSGIKNDFTCYVNNLKAELVYCEFEDNKGVAGIETYNLCFKTYKDEKPQSIRLEYDDRLFKAGIINFIYNKKTITELPNLSL